MSENEQFLKEWFQTPQGLGREVFEGFGYDENHKIEGARVFLTDYPSFASYIIRMQKGIYPCWMSVLSFQGKNSPVVLCKLYFDFDSKNLELAWAEAKDFATKNVTEGFTEKVKRTTPSLGGVGRTEIPGVMQPKILGDMLSQGLVPNQMVQGQQPQRPGFLKRLFGGGNR